MSPSRIIFRANPTERLAQPRTSAPAGRLNRYLAPVSVGVVYTILLSLLFFENRLDPPVAPPTDAVPIEIVVEPPPPETADKPAPDSPSTLEKPATDAPRSTDSDQPDDKSPVQAPKISPPPPKPPEPEREAGQSPGPPRPGAPEAAADDSAPTPDKPAEVTRPAAELNHDKADQQQARADAEKQTDKPGTSAVDAFQMFEPAPEFDFNSLFRKTPVGGGSADTTYLSILYGSIVPHLHAPASARGNWPRLEGMLEFSVDTRGNLVQRRIARRSGSSDLDAAALQALAEASPFPPPPKGEPLRFTFTYAAN